MLSLTQLTKSIKGIEKAKNLTDFNTLMGTAIVDYSPLKELTKMKNLRLDAFYPYDYKRDKIKREEIDQKLLEPVNIDFVESMPELIEFRFASRVIVDLRPLSKLSNLIIAQMYSSRDLIEVEPVTVSKDNSIAIKNSIEYNYDNGLDYWYDGVGDTKTVTIKDIERGLEKINVYIISSSSDYSFSHELCLSVPLVWK